MLVLTRKVGESIKVGEDIYIRVVQVKGKQVRIGVEAPRKTKVQREELKEKTQVESLDAKKAGVMVQSGSSSIERGLSFSGSDELTS